MSKVCRAKARGVWEHRETLVHAEKLRLTTSHTERLGSSGIIYFNRQIARGSTVRIESVLVILVRQSAN
jgi:hypothetical protein